jgi:hypothetical protein
MKRSFRLIAAIVFVGTSLFTAEACGPDFYPDTFVLRLRPDHPKEFSKGKLGVLLPTFPRADLTVAYRYLNAGSLTPREQAGYEPTYSFSDPEWEKNWDSANAGNADRDDPVEQWRQVHAKYGTDAPKVDQERQVSIRRPNGWVSQSEYENCGKDAFLTAVSTVKSRAKTWGEHSPDLADWLKGQDAVFSNCAGKVLVLPAPAPAASSSLLKSDRAYQIAAADFHGMQFGDARKAFESIAQDQGSPWYELARYLEARCLVRQAFYTAQPDDKISNATFDAGLMRQAAMLLESMLQEKQSGVSRKAIQKELDLIRIRTEPRARLRELATALAGPKTDPEYGQHLKDFTWYLDGQLDNKAIREDVGDDVLIGPQNWEHPMTLSLEARSSRFSKAYRELRDLRSSAPLVDWLVTFQSPAIEGSEQDAEEWRRTGQLCWLVAALAKATETDSATPDLIAAAGSVSSDSPAYLTLTYHRARLLLRLNRVKEARVLLDQTLPTSENESQDSATNLFLGLRMHASENLKEAMSYAPQKMLARTSEEQAALNECLEVMKNPKRKYDCSQKVDANQFSIDATTFFNTQAPLSTLVEVATSDMLPQQLRQDVALMAWTRSVLLKDESAAKELHPLLPAKLQEQAGAGTSFHALMALVRNPGLRPFLDSGVQRSYSYDFVESYADNWWCQNWEANSLPEERRPIPQEKVAYLTSDQISQAGREVAFLDPDDSAEVTLGNLVLAYAQEHPADPDVPESLFLVLRMIRYGCGHGFWLETPAAKERDRKVLAIRSSAARLLRQRYASSPWTRKSASFAG